MQSSSPQTFRVGFCGTGPYSVQCAEALHLNDSFEVVWVVTPPPKPVGRKKELTASPLDNWAQALGIQVFHVTEKLSALQATLQSAPTIDFLVVVSFGYLIPAWLLKLPRVAPINVHPSALPLYRGSSPGQFVLLYGETQSAVSIMKMNTKFDQGAVIEQLPITISPLETQLSYYDKAFELAADKLPQVLQVFADNGNATTQAPPPTNSPLARRLSREDGYIPYEIMQAALAGQTTMPTTATKLGPVLTELYQHQPSLTPTQLVDRAVRALTPWPGVWTIIPEYKDKTNVRQKVLAGTISQNRYHPTLIQYEGEAVKKLE